jgi:two-component system chemotaxis response regulator CheB
MHGLVGRRTKREAPGSAIELVLLAASAGGQHLLEHILGSLPRSYTLPIVIVEHVAAREPSLLASVLAFRSALPVRDAKAGEAVRPGTVYVAPAGSHLLITLRRRFALSHRAPEHFVRPSADLLFETAAAAYGATLLGVVLSGAGVDGRAGALAIREAGGRVLVQDPATTSYPGMPRAVIGAQAADSVLSIDEIIAILIEVG